MTKTSARLPKAPRKARQDWRPGGGPKSNYHHGDLRNALVQAGLESLEREGPDGLSLRGVAAQVGVSHAAPAHHFGSAKGLRTALAAVGYANFARAMRQARQEASPEPDAQMRAVGASYLAFAQSHPALFRLMFTDALLDWSEPSLQAAALLARAELTDICRPAADRLGLTDAAMRAALEHLVWSYAHGVAHLTVGGQFTGEPGSEAGVLDLSTLIFGGPLRLLSPAGGSP